MKDINVSLSLLKQSLYGDEQAQAKARNQLKQIVEETTGESEVKKVWCFECQNHVDPNNRQCPAPGCQ